MKKITVRFSIIFFLAIQSTFVYAQKKNAKLTDSICLQVIGLATEKNIPIDGAIVKLYKENEEMQWEEITSVVYHEHSFLFDLNKNSYYTVEVSKSGYVTRSVGISTTIPNDLVIGDVKFTFEFEVELFKEKKGMDDYYLDFPVALIKFNNAIGKFEYDSKYTKHIKAKISESTGQTSTSIKKSE
jgi:hypothetical protein